MIKNDIFVGNITTYNNYIITYCNNFLSFQFLSFQNFQEPVATLPEMELVTLLTGKYGYCGDFLYKIEVKQ